MNLRLQNYKLYRIHGLSAYRAGILAGYSHNTAWNAHKNIERRCNWDEMLTKEGLDDQSLLEVIKAGIEGKNSKTVKAFAELALKLSGKLKEKDINVNQTTNVINTKERTVIFRDIKDDLNGQDISSDVYERQGAESNIGPETV